jgi:hypothetical protein
MSIIDNLKSWKLFILVLLFGCAIVLIKGIPCLGQYTLSQFVSTLKYLSGEAVPNLSLYDAHIFEYFSKIYLMTFSHHLIHFLGVDFYQIDYIYYFAFTTLAFVSVFYLLKELNIASSLFLIFNTWFIVLNPLRNVIYGYQYEIGQAGASIGLMAFALITALFYFLIARKYVLHAIFLILLYGVHPLNLILYGAFFISYSFLKLFFFDKENFKRILFEYALNLILLAVLFFFSLHRYDNLSKETVEKIYYLTSLINGYGQAGGFFFSWMNPNKLVSFFLFTPSLLFLIIAAYKKKYINKEWFWFSLSYVIYVILMCGINYVAYRLKIYSLLPLDISRVFALQIPIAFSILIKVILCRYEEGSKNLAFFSLLLMICFPFKPFLIPIVFFLAIVGEEKYVTLGNIFAKYKTQLSYLILAATVILFSYDYLRLMRDSIKGTLQDDRDYGTLANYLNTNSDTTDIVLIEDKTFGYHAIRPNFVSYGSLAYGIYFGGIEKLEKEASLIWGIKFNKDYVKKAFDWNFSNRTKLAHHMRNFLISYSTEHIQKVKKTYPQFNYIVLEKDQAFINDDLPLKKVFANNRFQLYKVVLP